jgi:RimJ/RimL family protein N-acetyltransferase
LVGRPISNGLLEKKLNDADCCYYIFENKTRRVGQIRFDIKSENSAVISYLIAPDYRSNGMGTWILSKGIGRLVSDRSSLREIKGFVKKDNIASQRSFEKMAFTRSESAEYPDSYKYIMTLHDNSN